MVSVSLDGTHTDPAGVNFTVSNLKVHESNEMTSSLRNYIPNLLIRRNALTGMNFTESCQTCSGSCDTMCQQAHCASQESEVMIVEYQSRRTSVDSTVSVQSVKSTSITIMSNTVSNRHRKKRRQKRKDSSSSGSEKPKMKSRNKSLLRSHAKSYTANMEKSHRRNRRGACTGTEQQAIKAIVRKSAKKHRMQKDGDEVSIASVQMHKALSHYVSANNRTNDNDSLDSSMGDSQAIQHAQLEQKLMMLQNGAVFSMNRVNSAYRNVTDSADIGIQADAIDIMTRRSSYNNNFNGNNNNYRNYDGSEVIAEIVISDLSDDDDDDDDDDSDVDFDDEDDSLMENDRLLRIDTYQNGNHFDHHKMREIEEERLRELLIG